MFIIIQYISEDMGESVDTIDELHRRKINCGGLELLRYLGLSTQVPEDMQDRVSRN